jgi:hydrogenase maturation factor
LEAFEGAFFYYKLIAKSNKIKDIFDEKVVKAYWIGNNLLEKVKTEDLRKMIARDFSGPGLLSQKIAEKKAKEIPEGSKPHHSSHVLVIGSVTGRIKLRGKLLDLCRVGWGKVGKISNFQFPIPKLLIKYQPLVGKKVLRLGKPIEKEIFWNKRLVPNIKIGDWVSFHWDNAVQVLKKKEKNNLNKYTNLTLKLLKNSLKPSSENLTAISNKRFIL